MIHVERDLLANSAFYNRGELEWGEGGCGNTVPVRY